MGSLDVVPEAAKWKGPPGPLVTGAILQHTSVDARGHRYYRRSPWDGWIRLRGAADFQDLNTVIEKYRKQEAT